MDYYIACGFTSLKIKLLLKNLVNYINCNYVYIKYNKYIILLLLLLNKYIIKNLILLNIFLI